MISEKSKYIRLISRASNKYGNKLLDVMDCYKVNSLKELTEEQVKEYYERWKKQLNWLSTS